MDDMEAGLKYPTDEQLKTIREWKCDPLGLMAFIKPIWEFSDSYFHEEDALGVLEEPVKRFSLSTAGRSGNEEIIDALHDNMMFWIMYWQSSKRGGHYVYEIPKGKG